jgi:aspartyl-tRNA(Asn)/glutamyl-tRNA(Gln) amidotransferase subunit B
MIDAVTRAKYKTTIGIECHVQLKTKTKLFSAAGNDAREAPPNTLVNHIDFGLPGALPYLNKEAIYLASKAAFALNSQPQKFSKFDRKHYFYPDLPMGYQITQYEEPVVLGGSIDIEVDGQPKTIGITRAHLEADAGKSVHPAGKDYSLVDLNRAGTPLLEIVSEPDMASAAEAKAYARELYLRMRYADVSDANLYYGNMRFDVNVSVSQTNELGTRTETKNLNSFRAVEKAVEYEVNRQIEELEKGHKITQETRGWDDAKQKTFTQRTKENADDYRYMPDPDLPPVVLDDKYITDIKSEMPDLPPEIRKKLKTIGFDLAVVEDILDHPNILKKVLLASERGGAQTAKDAAFYELHAKNQLDTESAIMDDSEYIEKHVTHYVTISGMQQKGEISSNTAQEAAFKVRTNASDEQIKSHLETKRQVSDEGEIAKIVQQVIKDNAKAAEDVKNGEMKAIGFLVGQVMSLSQGKANPQLAQELIKKALSVSL